MSSREDEIGAALRDYALDQLAHADLQVARAGAWQHDGVHSARKAIARVRACVELLHKSPVAQRALERRLRSFAHGLSTMRDAQAVLATAKRMHKVDDTSGKAWRELARTLKQRRDRIFGAALAHDAGFAMRRSGLAEVRAALSRVAWTRLRTAELQGALERARKRVRRARDPAAQSRGREPRHRLRRRSRRLLLQIELLHGIAHDVSCPRAAAIARTTLHHVLGGSLRRKQRKHLIDRLGWEQDLQVLRHALPARATTAPTRRAVAALRRELAAAQAETNKLI